jgi:hypothetical protein
MIETSKTLGKMGQKPVCTCETAKRFLGNRKSTGNSNARLEAAVDALPDCEQHDATILCRPTGKFKAAMPSQRLETVQLPTWDQFSSENKRPRSQSIPVKINTALADDADSNNMQQYDLATWRMYNRMVVHRLKYPVDVSQDGAPSVSRQASDIATLHSRYHSSHNGKLSSGEMVDDSNFYLEGEVFELEL